MYGLIAMFNTVVDSLGKSVICSYFQYRSEQSDHIIKALKHFSLGREGVTFMTDDGPAYHVVADQFKMKHPLCTKHYHNLIFPSKAGLKDLASDHQQCMFDSIYKKFSSVEALENHFKGCHERFGHAPAARKFMTSLYRDQRLVCKTHTSWFFTAGCSSTQRGEGTNSRIKGGGMKKGELRNFSLFQLLRWYLDEVKLQEEKH